MRIISLAMEEFAQYEKCAVNIPNGMTLLVGDNGQGKSTLLEAVYWALYGEMIRGVSASGYVKLIMQVDQVGSVVVERNKKQSTFLKLSINDQLCSGQTVSETQDKLIEIFGTRLQFASTRLFAREFLTHFGIATNAERIALLESALGLGRFDTALRVLRDRTSFVLTEVSTGETLIGTLRNQVARAVLELTEHDGVAGRPLIAIRAELSDIAATIKKKTSTIDSLNLLIVSLQSREHRMALKDAEFVAAVSLLCVKKAELEKRLSTTQTFGVGAICPICLRKVAERDKRAIIEQLERDIIGVAKDLTSAARKSSAVRSDIADIAEECSALQAQRQDAEDAARELAIASRALSSQAELAAAWEAVGASLGSRVADLQRQLNDAMAQCSASVATLCTHRAAEQVLGLRGARMMLFSRALGRLQDEANIVLARLGLDMQIALAGTTKLKSGKEVDTLSIKVVGAGGGDYSACSSGERARLDLSLLLGLARLSKCDGFMAFDEVFDALDPDGVEAVSTYLTEVARDRQVIVISHHAEFRDLFTLGTVMGVTRDIEGSHISVI